MRCGYFYLLKAYRPFLRDYLHKPPDYRHLDKLIVTFCSKREGNCLLLENAHKQTDEQRDEWMDGSYQMQYLPATRSINIALLNIVELIYKDIKT